MPPPAGSLHLTGLLPPPWHKIAPQILKWDSVLCHPPPGHPDPNAPPGGGQAPTAPRPPWGLHGASCGFMDLHGPTMDLREPTLPPCGGRAPHQVPTRSPRALGNRGAFFNPPFFQGAPYGCYLLRGGVGWAGDVLGRGGVSAGRCGAEGGLSVFVEILKKGRTGGHLRGVAWTG